jgi:hypothetical protein
MALPELVIEHCDLSAGALIVKGLDAAAKQRMYAEEAAGVSSEIDDKSIFRDSAAGDFHVVCVEAEHALNGRRLTQGFELLLRDREPARVVWMLLVDEDRVHDAVRVGVGEGVEQHGVDEREHCGGGADAEGERENGDGGEAGIAAQSAEAVADVAAELVEEAHADGGAICFVLRRGLTQVDASFALGFFGSEPLAHEVFLIGLLVRAEFFFDIAVAARRDGAPETTEGGEDAHISSAFLSRMRATTAAMSAHFAVSDLS